MCHLNLLIKERKDLSAKQLADLTNFMISVTSNSYVTNNDGEGIYFSCDDKLVKGYKKVNLINHMKSILKSDILLTHQRIATSGYEESYVQPFKSKNQQFVLAHNGIMNEFIGKKGSDTYGFFNQFIYLFTNSKGKREVKIIKAIKKLLDKKEGSYSIALYDKKAHKLYYFKNSGTWIYFYKSQDGKMLYITTEEDNKLFLEMFNKKFNEIEIDDLGIYRVSVNKRVNIKKIGDIKDTKWWSAGTIDTDEDLTKNTEAENTRTSYRLNNLPIKRSRFNDGGLVNEDKQLGWYSQKNKRRTTTEEDIEFIFGKEAERFKNKIEREERQRKKSNLKSMLNEYEECGLLSDDELGFTEVADTNFCRDCGRETHIKNKYDGEVICKICIENNREILSALKTEEMVEAYEGIRGMDGIEIEEFKDGEWRKAEEII